VVVTKDIITRLDVYQACAGRRYKSSLAGLPRHNIPCLFPMTTIALSIHD